MRVAITNDLHSKGGAVALMAHRFTRALQDAGHEATLITGQGEDPLPTDVPVEGWQYPERTGESTWDLLRFYKKLRARSTSAFERWFLKTQAIPNLWVALVIPSALGALDGGGRRLPLLYVCNSPWAMEWLAAAKSTNGAEPQGSRRALGVWPRVRSERKIVSRAAAWTALSQIQMDWFLEQHPMCGSIPRHVVPAAVDSDQFLPLTPEKRLVIRWKYGVGPALKLMVCSRRLVPRTGVDLLIDAMAKLPENARLVITGEGPERERLEARARELGLLARVTFAGFLNREELVELTAAADLCVLPTRDLEGFGLSAAEAMSSGTPVVATPVGALVDVVGGLDKRLLSADTSVDALRAAIERAFTTPDLCNENFRRRSREYACGRYDFNVHKAAFVKLAESIARK